MSQYRAHGAAGRRVESQLRKEFRPYVRLFDRAGDLAAKVSEEAEVQPGDWQQIVCAALFGRLVRATQAGVLLALRGLEHDAIASLRNALELLTYLKRCSESKEFVETYLKVNLVRKRNLARAGQKVSGKTPEEIATYKEHEAHWDSLVKKTGAKKLVFEQVCEDAGMSDHYNTVYRLASDPIHAAPRILDDLAVTKEGALSEFDFGPKTDRLILNLRSLTEFLLAGVECFSTLVEIDEHKRLARIRRDLEDAAPSSD